MTTLRPDQNQPCYIALHGLPESGKTEVAKWLIANCGFTRIGFGDHLKQVVMIAYDLDFEQVYGDLKDVIDLRYGITPRFILQQLGTEVCRTIHPDTWIFPIKRILDDPNYHQPYFGETIRCDRVVIDDLRFPNEVDMLLTFGTVLIHIERPNHSPADPLVLSHESNRPLQTKFDMTISNDSDLPVLHTKLETLAQILKL